MTYFDLGEGCLVDVKRLIDELHFLACLVKIPLLEIRLDVFVNVVGPVEHFELMCAVRTAAGSQHDGYESSHDKRDLFHFSSCLELRMLI